MVIKIYCFSIGNAISSFIVLHALYLQLNSIYYSFSYHFISGDAVLFCTVQLLLSRMIQQKLDYCMRVDGSSLD